jgi:hypothetical protein
MKVLVSDTSVLVDLERGAIIDSCFRLPFEPATDVPPCATMSTSHKPGAGSSSR